MVLRDQIDGYRAVGFNRAGKFQLPSRNDNDFLKGVNVVTTLRDVHRFGTIHRGITCRCPRIGVEWSRCGAQSLTYVPSTMRRSPLPSFVEAVGGIVEGAREEATL